MLNSGVYGQVVSTGEESIGLRVAPDLVITVHRHAVGRLLDDETVTRLRAEGATSWELG
jgi:preprotein translocase subunit YajC